MFCDNLSYAWRFTVQVYEFLVSSSVRSEKLTFHQDSLLTARPWAEHSSCSARGLFFPFFSYVGDQYQASARPYIESRNLWCLYAKNCWNINTPEDVTDIVFFIVSGIYFLFGFIKALDSKGLRSCLFREKRWSSTHCSQEFSREKYKTSALVKNPLFTTNSFRNV